VPLLFFEIPKLWSPLVFFPAGFFMPFFPPWRPHSGLKRGRPAVKLKQSGNP